MIRDFSSRYETMSHLVKLIMKPSSNESNNKLYPASFPDEVKWILMNFPNRDELSFLAVLALP